MLKRKFLNTYNLVVIAILTAMSLVLSEFPQFAIFPAVPFLTVDFSDLPIIFSAFFIHPLAAVIISLVKNIAGLPTSATFFVGELSNFLLSCIYSLTASLIFMKSRTRTKVIITSLLSVFAVSFAAMLSNYFAIFPLYMKLGGFTLPEGFSLARFMYTYILPFNLIKFGLQTAAFLILYLSLEKVFYRLKPEYCRVIDYGNQKSLPSNTAAEKENKKL